MGQSIDNALKIQFGDMVHIKAQQIKARMKPYVQILKMSGDKFAYDGLGDVEATEVKGRIQPVVFQDIEHLRRKITRRRFAITLPIDENTYYLSKRIFQFEEDGKEYLFFGNFEKKQ